jgi:hypothetical protein
VPPRLCASARLNAQGARCRLLLAECDLLVLQLSGEYARLAFELAAARRGAPPPYLSLDAYAWAPRYALAAAPRWWERAAPFAFEELVAHRGRRGA